MHIKNVAIEAFLTYEKLEMTDLKLDRGCNLILGKNGSGKSSFLQGKFRQSSLFYTVYFSNHFRTQRQI